MKVEPVVHTWELYAVANMLVSTHGNSAEEHAQAKLEEARETGHEGNEIVWTGILAQLIKIRNEARSDADTD